MREVDCGQELLFEEPFRDIVFTEIVVRRFEGLERLEQTNRRRNVEQLHPAVEQRSELREKVASSEAEGGSAFRRMKEKKKG